MLIFLSSGKSWVFMKKVATSSSTPQHLFRRYEWGLLHRQSGGVARLERETTIACNLGFSIRSNSRRREAS